MFSRARLCAFLVILVAVACAIAACEDDVSSPNDTQSGPTASFTLTRFPEGAALRVVVDASASSDPEDPASTLVVRWDWEGDGTWDTEYSATKTAEHMYSGGNDRTIRLEVRDTQGHTATSSQTSAWPVPLVCEADGQPRSGEAPLTVEFTSNLSGGVGPLAMKWTFGDGGTSSLANASHQYQAGAFEAVFDVADPPVPANACRIVIPITVIDRGTIQLLLTQALPAAYSRQDSILYERLLDDAYQFEFLQEDADQIRETIGSNNFWGKTLELRSAGALFRSENVTNVVLAVRARSSQPYLGEDCEQCTEVETSIILRVTTEQDGTDEPLIFAVDSPQTFVVKPDPDAAGRFVIFRQIDRARFAPRTELAGAAESNSWGRIKGSFR